MSTVLPMLGLDPDTEKKNLESERGTVFDPNAPKTGPLPNSGGIGEPNPGAAPKQTPGTPATPVSKPGDNKDDEDKKPANPPTPSNGPVAPNPSVKETSLQVDDFFSKSGDSQEKQKTRKITKILSQQHKDGER